MKVDFQKKLIILFPPKIQMNNGVHTSSISSLSFCHFPLHSFCTLYNIKYHHTSHVSSCTMANLQSPFISALVLSILLAILAAVSALPANLRFSNSTSLAPAFSSIYWRNNSVVSLTGNAQSSLNAGLATSSLSFIGSNATNSSNSSALSSPTTFLDKYIGHLASPTAQGSSAGTSSVRTLPFLSSPSPSMSEVKAMTNTSRTFPSTLPRTMNGSCSCDGCTSSSWITGRRSSPTHTLNTTGDPFRSSWAFLSELPPMRTGYCSCEGCTSSSWVTSRQNSTAGSVESALAPLITSTTNPTNSTADPFQSSWAFLSALPLTRDGSCSVEGCKSTKRPTPPSQHIIEPTSLGNMPPAPTSTISRTARSSSWDNAPPTATSTKHHTILTWHNVPLPTLPAPPRPTVTVWIARSVSTVTTVYMITTVTRTTGFAINTIYTTPITLVPTMTVPTPPVVAVVTTVTSVIPSPPPPKPQCSKHPRFDCCIYEKGQKDGIRECFGPGPRPGHPQCRWWTVKCCADYQKGYFIPGSCRGCVEVC